MPAPEATVIHIRDMRAGDVYISRAVPRRGLKKSKWHNPYPVETHGRDGALTLYREHIEGCIARDPATYDLGELRGKRLACWCKPGDACHGNVLAELADA